MYCKRYTISFDYCSSGLWGIEEYNGQDTSVGVDAVAVGLSSELAIAIQEWNDSFSSCIHARDLHVKQKYHYTVTKEIANMFKPIGEYLAALARKELPGVDIEYAYYVDGGHEDEK